MKLAESADLFFQFAPASIEHVNGLLRRIDVRESDTNALGITKHGWIFEQRLLGSEGLLGFGDAVFNRLKISAVEIREFLFGQG